MKREKKNDCALRLCGTQGFDAICQLVSFLGRSCQSDCVSVWTLDTSAAAAATKFVFLIQSLGLAWISCCGTC